MISWNFIEDFINKNDLAPELYAIESWDKELNELKFNNKIYDFKNKLWFK